MIPFVAIPVELVPLGVSAEIVMILPGEVGTNVRHPPFLLLILNGVAIERVSFPVWHTALQYQIQHAPIMEACSRKMKNNAVNVRHLTAPTPNYAATANPTPGKSVIHRVDAAPVIACSEVLALPAMIPKMSATVKLFALETPMYVLMLSVVMTLFVDLSMVSATLRRDAMDPPAVLWICSNKVTLVAK